MKISYVNHSTKFPRYVHRGIRVTSGGRVLSLSASLDFRNKSWLWPPLPELEMGKEDIGINVHTSKRFTVRETVTHALKWWRLRMEVAYDRYNEVTLEASDLHIEEEAG